MAMEKAQGAGEVMALALMDHAGQLGESARITQEALAKEIEQLVAMEARVKVAVQSIHVVVQRLEDERVKMEAERAKLQAIGPALQQQAIWAMRETLREQSGQIKTEMKTEVRNALDEPIRHIKDGAGYVRQNVKETRWLTILCYGLLGCVLGLMGGYMPIRRSVIDLEEHVTAIDQALAAKQQAVPATAAAPAPTRDQKKKAK